MLTIFTINKKPNEHFALSAFPHALLFTTDLPFHLSVDSCHLPVAACFHSTHMCEQSYFAHKGFCGICFDQKCIRCKAKY